MMEISDIERRFGIIEKDKQRCANHGDYESICRETEEGPRWTGCPECARLRKAQEQTIKDAQEARERRARKTEKMIGRLGVPPRFNDCTFDNYVVSSENRRQGHNLTACREYVETFPERCQRGENLILMGNKGTGKTHLAAAMAAYIIKEHELSVIYTVATKMFRRLKDTFGRSGETEGEVIEAYASPDLLIIDEIGMGHCSATELGHLFEIVNERYEHRRPTMILTNLSTSAELETWLGERTMDRLREDGKALLFDWDSQRGSKIS